MGWFRRLSLRGRLMLIGTGGLAVGLLLGGLLLVSVLRVVLDKALDSGARRAAADVVDLIDANGLVNPVPTAGTQFVQVVDDQNRVLAASITADRINPLLHPDELARAQQGRVVIIGGDRVGTDGEDELHRLARTLNRMLDRLEAARSRQRTFVADAAHELRSPIASLRTQLDVAAHLGEPPALADLSADVDRLGRLVSDLLLLARADEGDPGLRGHEPVELRALLTEVAGAYASARVPVAVAPGGPQWTVGDPVALRRMVDNLVGNAVRHATSAVTLAAQRSADRAVLTVTDDGPGIPEPDRARVFDRFTRLDDARTRDDGGAGLGLAIVHELVRLHGGTVTLGNAAPGLRVAVALPATEPPGAGPPTAPAEPAAASRSAPPVR